MKVKKLRGVRTGKRKEQNNAQRKVALIAELPSSQQNQKKIKQSLYSQISFMPQSISYKSCSQQKICTSKVYILISFVLSAFSRFFLHSPLLSSISSSSFSLHSIFSSISLLPPTHLTILISLSLPTYFLGLKKKFHTLLFVFWNIIQNIQKISSTSCSTYSSETNYSFLLRLLIIPQISKAATQLLPAL